MTLSYRLILLFTLTCSNHALAGFCDTTGAKQEITNIHIHGSRVYVSVSPGLQPQADAAECSIRNEVALNLGDAGAQERYTLLVAAMLTGTEVRLTYCSGCITHGYKGGTNTLPVLSSFSASK